MTTYCSRLFHLKHVLAAVVSYGMDWFIEFAPLKTMSSLISLKADKHDIPPFFLNGIQITPEDTIKILGFIFDITMTREA